MALELSLLKDACQKAGAVIEHAVKGMLPKNQLGRNLSRKLKVYRGPSHPHAAQQPEPLEIEG